MTINYSNPAYLQNYLVDFWVPDLRPQSQSSCHTGKLIAGIYRQSGHHQVMVAHRALVTMVLDAAPVKGYS